MCSLPSTKDVGKFIANPMAFTSYKGTKAVKKAIVPKIPEITPPKVPKIPQQVEGDPRKARAKTRREAIGYRGRSSTILTGGKGLQGEAFTTRKNLLGE